MAKAINMPQVGQDIETARILEWHVKEGDEIKEGQIIATVESDKASFEVEAFENGVLLQLLFDEGDEAPVFKPIAFVGKVGEKILSHVETPKEKINNTVNKEINTKSNTNRNAETKKRFISPAAKRVVKAEGIDLNSVKGTGPNGRIIKRDLEIIPNVVEEISQKITPLAKEIAKQENVKTDKITGTGTNGKITRNDILASIEARNQNKFPKESIIASGIDEVIYYSKMRKIIADRLTLSKQTIPHFNLFRDYDVTELLEWRKKINFQTGSKISVTDLLISAISKSLKRSPRLNAYVDHEKIIIKKDINIGLAVAVDDGLLVPCVAGADKLNLGEISKYTKKIAENARHGVVDPTHESTISLSNLGMYGVNKFMAIINPPECAILSVGNTEKKVVPQSGGLLIRDFITIGLACDHRAVDGAYAANFLNELDTELKNLIAG